MTDLTQTQWMWIIGIAAVLLFGGLGYYFYTRGELGMRGVQFQTGFGVGDSPRYGTPCTAPIGAPGHGERTCKEYCWEYWSGREGGVKGYPECVKEYCDKGLTCCEVCKKYGYSADSCNSTCTR